MSITVRFVCHDCMKEEVSSFEHNGNDTDISEDGIYRPNRCYGRVLLPKSFKFTLSFNPLRCRECDKKHWEMMKSVQKCLQDRKEMDMRDRVSYMLEHPEELSRELISLADNLYKNDGEQRLFLKTLAGIMKGEGR